MKKILIVENEPQTQATLREILSEKYETVCVSSGEEAASRYAEEQPDMILSELNMPGMSGLDLLHLLTERYKELVPLMFMADDTDDDESESLGLQSGAMDFIGKPFKPSVLLRRVDNTMLRIDNLRQIQGLRVVAETDTMTGLLNKTFAHKTLFELCSRAKGVLMMLDLDNFKLVNDIYGHDMGDRVLIRFAEILRGFIRSSDVAGRMGGDEFIIFCRDIRSERLVSKKASAINASFLAAAKELIGEDMTIPLGVSVGAVFVPDGGTDFDELYRKADKALYSVKQNGKHDCMIFRERNDDGSSEAHAASSDLLNNARKILGERNRQDGAYEIGFENFRTMYRFFVRMLENYHNDAEFVVFSFPAGESEATIEAFGSLLRRTLRRSDVYTRSGDSQYMALLPQPIPDHGEVAIHRVLDKWRKLGEEVVPACEHEPVELPE